jgi:Flp pilus assembly protein TadD
MSPRIGFRSLLAAFCLGALAGSGCTSLDPRLDREATLIPALRARQLDPEKIIVPFDVTPEMKAWARREVRLDGEVRERLGSLIRALFDRSGLKLEYESDYSVTAAEAFASHRANCLSFTNLFVGLARELGMPAYFLEVDDVQRFTREGDLVVVSGHVTAAYGPPEERITLDFTEGRAAEYREVREISDLRAIALYYSNRGAGELREGRHGEALRWLETTVVLDPDLAGGWSNLGVARRRLGDYAGAEHAYRRALEVDPKGAWAYQNLATLLRLRGRDAEASELLAFSRQLDSKNPFLYLDLGDLSLAQGRADEAERLYRRALRLDNRVAESYAALGLLAHRQGKPRDAERYLRKAEQSLRVALARTTSLAAAQPVNIERIARLREALRRNG